MTRPDRKEMKEALERPSRAEAGEMGFGARPEEAAPPGSADAAVKRAAAGWAGRREDSTNTREAAMAEERDDKLSPKVPTERPDPAAASRDPGPDATDRPGFDLGGAKRVHDETTGDETSTAGTGNQPMPKVAPGGPLDTPGSGATATGRAGGLGGPGQAMPEGREGDTREPPPEEAGERFRRRED